MGQRVAGWRFEPRVREAVVHRGQAGALGVTQPRDLQRGGFEREDVESVVRSVQREVDQDVHAVGCDGLRQLRGRLRAEFAPSLAAGAEFLAHGVGDGVGVAIEFEALGIEASEGWQQGAADDMVAQVGRNEAETQASVGVGHVRVFVRRGGMQSVPALMG